MAGVVRWISMHWESQVTWHVQLYSSASSPGPHTPPVVLGEEAGLISWPSLIEWLWVSSLKGPTVLGPRSPPAHAMTITNPLCLVTQPPTHRLWWSLAWAQHRVFCPWTTAPRKDFSPLLPSWKHSYLSYLCPYLFIHLPFHYLLNSCWVPVMC